MMDAASPAVCQCDTLLRPRLTTTIRDQSAGTRFPNSSFCRDPARGGGGLWWKCAPSRRRRAAPAACCLAGPGIGERPKSHNSTFLAHRWGGTRPCACGSSRNTRAAAPASAALGAPRSSNSPTAIADCAGAARSAPAVAEREELRVVATRPSGRSTRARAAQPSLGQARSDARVDCGTTQLIRGDSVPIRSAIVARR